MGLFRKSEKRAEELNEDNGAVLLSALIRGDSMSKAMALEIPAVSACVGLIADRIASLPLRLYDSSGGKVTEVDDDVRVGYINGDTGDTLSGSEMLKAWVADYFLTKGAYTYIYKNGYGKVLGLYYVRSEDVSINSNCKLIFKGYAICCDGATYLPHEFIKILRNSKGDGRGHSIIEENPLILSVAYNTISFENQLVKKGGNKKGFLKAKNRLTDAAMDKIKEAWKNLYSNNGENVIVLNDGMDFAESSNTSVEMQLNERKISTDTAICSLFGVPYDMLTGNASEAVKVRFFENAVMPVINAIEAALDRDLLLEGEKDHRYFAFDTREATRGDIQTRYNAYAVALQNNFMQLDEVRKLEDLEPLGVNYVKLGLNDVLLDPKTGRIYTPNTNAMVDMGTGSGAVLTNAEDGDTIEERAKTNWIKGPDGKFQGSYPGGGGTAEDAKSELRAKIENGELSTKLDKDKQGEHIIGNPGYKRRIANGEFPSYITVSKMEIQKIINAKSLTGQVKKGKDGQYWEVITADDHFGVACSLITHESVRTNRGVIHYSKSGAHLVPTFPKE